MNNKNIIVGVVAVLAVVFGVAFLKQTTVVNNVQVPENKTVGAIPGDTLNSRVFDINGVNQSYDRKSFSLATSTFCVIPPPQATSTLVRFTAKNTSATSTSVLYVLEKRTNSYAPNLSAATTSKVVSSMILAANDDGMFSVTATTSPSAADADNLEVTPQQYLVLYGKNGGGGTIPQDTTIGTIFTGGCNSVLMKE